MISQKSHLGETKHAERYQQAEKALKANPNITRVVGHSLGGSVALELQKIILTYKQQLMVLLFLTLSEAMAKWTDTEIGLTPSASSTGLPRNPSSSTLSNHHR